MDEKWNKSSGSSNEIISPVLLRRRLSAPETIMRKHTLAQQDSQDSEVAHSETKIYHYRNALEAGSDSNLNKKSDPDLMRKTTLLRRLWSHSKPLTNSRFSGTFSEWQHSYGKLSGRSTYSLTSVHSSPEHLVRSQSKRLLNEELKTSPQHYSRKISPKHQIYDTTKRQIKSNTDSETSKTVTTSTKTPKTTTGTETTSTRYNTSYTTFSDNSDSAYTNSNNFSEFSNNNTTTPDIQKEVAEDTEASNQDLNSAIEKSDPFVKYSSANETATQTVGTTNVNVISNVQLSQSTLDLIFNQVMRDVKSQSSDVDIETEANIVQVKQIPSFYLKRKNSADSSKHSHIVKCMISNVGVGSPYTKPPENPQIAVPRFSARPYTSSMEVNVSSGESTDKESDTISLVDSLEDTSSLRTDPAQNEVVANRSDISLELPDNSDIKKVPSKPTAFFIPIEIDSTPEFKAVSDHLPAKVRNRLTRRQQKREERMQNKSKQSSSRSDSNYISASENGHVQYIVDNGDVNLNSVPLSEFNYEKGKRRSHRPFLPSIDSFRKIKIDKRDDDKRGVKSKPLKRKVVKENLGENSYTTKIKQTQWIPKVKSKKEKLSPLYTSKNEYMYDYGPRKIYHKTEFNDSSKRIEILEIMECVDVSEKQSYSKSKSRIPVLINHKLPKIHQRQKIEKPAFLDLDNVPMSDPKLDQLIANILIETLNIPDIQSSANHKPYVQERDEKASERPSGKSPASSKYCQKFEVIPEELSFQSSTDNNDISNNNETKSNVAEEKNSYQGKAAIAVVKDENFSSIPKGWITFYMLHNNRGSPDSTSDEGKKLDDCQKKDVAAEISVQNLAENKITVRNDSAYSNVTYDVVKRDNPYESNGNCSSSSEMQTKTILPQSNNRHKKYNQKKLRHKSNNEPEKAKVGEWSVTVSGTNSYGPFVPDLEMCLKFPDSQKNYNCPSQSDSGLGEDNEQKSLFPKISAKPDHYKKSQDGNEDIFTQQGLPNIGRSKTSKKQRRSDSSIPSLSSRIEPRQTRTSTRRYNLTRPKIDYNKLDTPRTDISLFNDSHYAEILRRFPEILSITGNAVNQGRK